jgi:hypothetical protein
VGHLGPAKLHDQLFCTSKTYFIPSEASFTIENPRSRPSCRVHNERHVERARIHDKIASTSQESTKNESGREQRVRRKDHKDERLFSLEDQQQVPLKS